MKVGGRAEEGRKERRKNVGGRRGTSEDAKGRELFLTCQKFTTFLSERSVSGLWTLWTVDGRWRSVEGLYDTADERNSDGDS